MGYCWTRAIFNYYCQLLVSSDRIRVAVVVFNFLILTLLFCSRGAQGCLLVYDVSSRDSFEHVSKWFDRARQLGGEDLITILVGNKIDLPDHERQVTTQEGELLARELNIPFLETSALSGSNVESVFVTMTRDIKKLVDSRGLTGIKGKNLKLAGGVTLANREQGGRSLCGCS